MRVRVRVCVCMCACFAYVQTAEVEGLAARLEALRTSAQDACEVVVAASSNLALVSRRQCPVDSVPSTVSRRQCPVDSVPSTVSRRQRPVGSVPSAVSRRQCPVDSVPSTVSCRQCPVDSVPSAVSCRQCPVGSVLSTVSCRQCPVGMRWLWVCWGLQCLRRGVGVCSVRWDRRREGSAVKAALANNYYRSKVVFQMIMTIIRLASTGLVGLLLHFYFRILQEVWIWGNRFLCVRRRRRSVRPS